MNEHPDVTLRIFGLCSRSRWERWFALAACCAAGTLLASAATVYQNDFEAYTSLAASLADEADADPTGLEWNVSDDAALAPTTAGAGVQVIDWIAGGSGGANKSLLVRPGAEAQINFRGARSGSTYQFDFQVYTVREEASDRNFYLILRGEGSDFNGDDYLAYRVDRTAGSTALFYYDGVGPSAPAWAPVGADLATDRWQHHRIIIDANALSFDVYIDDMTTPVLTGAELSRCEVGVPTLLRIVNEGNSADDGYFAIDDIQLTVTDSIDLTTTFVDGFENYPARADLEDNANPQGPWVTTELDGTGSGKSLALAKVQVVGTDDVQAHSGSKCLKIEGGQRAGVSLAWGTPPESDVQITWWARVPASIQGVEATYLRMSLYGAENGNSLSGDNALLGYGSRNASVGDDTSLTYYTTGWLDAEVDYSPDTWEEYRLTTHTALGRYTIVKNPSSANPTVVVDRAPMIGTASDWSPVFMAGWSSSNGSGHPPVYIDDVEVKSLVSDPEPLPNPYTIQIDGNRFTNSTVLLVGTPIGSVAVDPRDHSTIVFAVDVASGGGIFRATKSASGVWAVDETPLVSGLSNPSGLTIAPDGAIWWVNDFTMALMRLKAPWTTQVPEVIISDFVLFPDASSMADDDPFDVAIAPANFTGSLGQPGMVLVMDRGVDDNANNAILLVDPATTELNQVNYSRYLVEGGSVSLGSSDLVGMTVLSQSGEVVTLCLDGQVTAVNADGSVRSFWPGFYSDPSIPIVPASIAADPVTGRLWIADDAMHEIWSIAPDGVASPDRKEVSFPLTDPARTDFAIDFHEPGLAFAQDGSFAVVSDGSTANGGGRLLILHNEASVGPLFSFTSIARTAEGIQLSWEATGTSKYRVQRAAALNTAAFADITEDLTTTSYTDTTVGTGNAFYRIVAKP